MNKAEKEESRQEAIKRRLEGNKSNNKKKKTGKGKLPFKPGGGY